MFSWVYGAEKLVRDANGYSLLKLPAFYAKIWRYFTPTILVAVFLGWLATDVFGLFGGKLSYQIENLTGFENPVAWASVGLVAFFCLLFGWMIFRSREFREGGK